jgi:hypothetical protein
MAAQSSLVQVFRRAGRCPPRPPERGRSACGHNRCSASLPTGRTPGGESSSGARGTRSMSAAALPPTICFGYFTGAARLQPRPRPALVTGRHAVTGADNVPRWATPTMPGTSGPMLSRCARSRAAPPAAQSGAVAPRVLAAPLRWRLGAQRGRWPRRSRPSQAGPHESPPTPTASAAPVGGRDWLRMNHPRPPQVQIFSISAMARSFRIAPGCPARKTTGPCHGRLDQICRACRPILSHHRL